MSSTFANLAQNQAQAVINHTMRHITWVRNVMMGAGMAYAIEKEKYWHLPFIFIIPSPYAGFQAYKNRQAIREYLSDAKSSTKHLE